MYLSEFGMGGGGFWTHGWLPLLGMYSPPFHLPELLVSIYLLRASLNYPSLIA